ncbi:MAG: sulfite exporter TauE/SafE family protein [Prevotellaceae bacterium]|jgi:uncharacterized membrane protein YfcA|nr:sulfite exporter TauE/SafE family protein [Prevotellaceae bacterium]
MDGVIYLIVVLSGICCGFINTIAGGGSMITIPVLIAAGIPANEANATNRLGFLFQSVVASWQLKRKQTFEWKQGLWPSIPLMLGTLVGSFVAVYVDATVITRWLGLMMIVIIPFLFFKPEKWLKPRQHDINPRPTWWLNVIYLVIGVYAGFLQAGVGYFLLTAFILGAGYDLLTANSLKVFVVTFTTIAGLLVFILHSHHLTIHYGVGLAQAAGQALGAYLGAHFAVRWNPKVIRWFIVATISTLSVKLLFFS